MTGWKTIVTNLIALLASCLLVFGIELSPEDQAALASGLTVLITVANLVLRHFTTTPPGYKQ